MCASCVHGMMVVLVAMVELGSSLYVLYAASLTWVHLGTNDIREVEMPKTGFCL